MTDYAVNSGRSAVYPKRHYGAHFTGNRATFFENADFTTLDSNVRAIPNLPIRVLSASRVMPPEEFFGMHVQKRVHDNINGITFRTIRSLDMAGGKGFWHRIETSPGVFDWTDLDQWVNMHHAAGRDLILVLFGTPTFYSARPTEVGAYGPGAPGAQAEPADMTKWSRYCTAVASRYLGKVKYYEIWNEPNLNSNGAGVTTGPVFFFSGTFAKLSEMTRLASQAIKAIDPAAKIISSPVTAWAPVASSADTYFINMMAAPDGASGTMKDWIDIVGVHLYLHSGNDTSELSRMIDRINECKAAASVSEKETWDTESAPLNPPAIELTDDEAKRIMARMLITIAAKGVSRTMYYQYDNGVMGIVGRSAIISYREEICQLLRSGKINSVVEFKDGRVAYATNAGLTII